MSLINQMLKDLEKRRANEINTDEGTLQSVHRYVAARPGELSGWVLSIIVLLVLVTIMLGYLLWDKSYFNPEKESSITNIPQLPELIEKKQLNKTKSTRIKAKQNNKNKPDKIKKLTKREINPLSNQTSATSSSDIILDDFETGTKESNNVYKQNRGLTLKQQAGALYQKAYSNIQAGQVNTAEDELRRSLEIDNTYSRSRELLAGSYIRSGRYIEAGQLLEQGLIVEPKNYHFAKLHARVLMQQSKKQQALSVLIHHRPALQADQEYFALIAALYQQTQQHQKAINMYKDLLQLQPDHGLWWIGLGISLEKSAKLNDAQLAYNKAMDSGSLNANMRRYTNNKLTVLKERGFPVQVQLEEHEEE